MHRYNNLSADEFEFGRLTLQRACGAYACDSNHLDDDPKGCISYEGTSTSGNKWALHGCIYFKGQYENVEEAIEFRSSKLADIFCAGTERIIPGDVIDGDALLKGVDLVLEEYKKKDITFDLVFWVKFSSSG